MLSGPCSGADVEIMDKNGKRPLDYSTLTLRDLMNDQSVPPTMDGVVEEATSGTARLAHVRNTSRNTEFMLQGDQAPDG